MEDSPEILERFHSALPMVERIARRFRRSLDSRFELDDLVAAGRQGLLDAARKFDPARGVPFAGYAHIRIRGGVIKEIRDASELSGPAYHRAIALRAATWGNAHEVSEAALEIAALQGQEFKTEAEAEQALDNLMASFATATAVGLVSEAVTMDVAESSDLEEELIKHELLTLVKAEIDSLSEQEGRVLRGMYFEAKTVDDLAPELGCDRSWVSRLHKKGMGRLQKRLSRIDAEV